MESKIWFKRKIYGWGWTPCTWQGWAVTFSYAALLIGGRRLFPEVLSSRKLFYWCFLLVTTVALLFICYKKGERPEWSWGKTPTK